MRDILAVWVGHAGRFDGVELKRSAALGLGAVFVVHVVVLHLDRDVECGRERNGAVGLVQLEPTRAKCAAAGFFVSHVRNATLDEIPRVVVDYERLEDDLAAAFYVHYREGDDVGRRIVGYNSIRVRPVIIVGVEQSPGSALQQSELNIAVVFQGSEIERHIDRVFELGPVVGDVVVQTPK